MIGTARSCFRWFVILLFFGAATAQAQEPAEFVPTPGAFPPPNSGHYFAGELVAVDPVNRRGALRLDGDFTNARYHSAPSHKFALLPYGMVRYHGAPAELRDVPIGTHLHGYFYLPPEGDDSIPPPVGTPQEVKYVPKHNHAVSLEDDTSFYTRRGQTWKIAEIDLKKGKLRVISPVTDPGDGLTGEQTFSIDRSTRVWKGRAFAELKDMAAGQDVQFNLNWDPNWSNRVFQVSDIWIEAESREVAAERQRQIHIRYQRYRWLAASVDRVDQQQGGAALVTLTIFGGMDPSLYEELEATKTVSLAVAEKTLRRWWHQFGFQSGRVVSFERTENPPLGSSGIRLQVQMDVLLEGYRAGRVVRVRPTTWPSAKLPPEERVDSFEDADPARSRLDIK